ncbi:unnamed protein product [Allacma fusca]|uniref:Transposase domain-containing protein n=1 Tax=Allacma fusca TaxID=39272 RepID=A0A8J2JGD2_9HEXA|nr:unnamed protein product [Allacma fusca]
MPKTFSKRHLRRIVSRAVALDLDTISDNNSAPTINDCDSNSKIIECEVHNCEKNYNYNASSIQPRFASRSSNLEAANRRNSESDTGALDYSTEFSGSTEESKDDQTNCPQEEEIDLYLPKQLQIWALKENIKHSSLDSLLLILRQHHPELPKSAKTLLHTPTVTNVITTPVYQTLFLGIQTGILDKLKSGTLAGTSKLTLHFNIDGIPLFNNSTQCFWPILCAIKECKDRSPFTIQISMQNSKPKSLQNYLDNFVQELSEIVREGITYRSVKYSLGLETCLFICDAPARAFIKSVKGHTGYFGCEKCEIEGEWNRKVTFPVVSGNLRTDVSFTNRSQDEHHLLPFATEKSPLERLGIGMISQIPLDYMHLVCLENVKILVSLWMRGPLEIRIPTNSVSIISKNLQSLRSSIPSDFQRKPRDLQLIDRWKATECRLFLLYLGPVVLKNVLKPEVYANFLMLSVAIRILVGNKSHLYSFAKTFRAVCEALFRSLRKGTYGQIKRMLRSGNKPSQQIQNRIKENSVLVRNTINEVYPLLKSPHSSGPTIPGEPDVLQFRKCIQKSFILTTSTNDSFALTKDGTVIHIMNFVNRGGIVHALCKYYSKQGTFFDNPIPSSHLNIFRNQIASANIYCVPLDHIVCKLLAIETDNYLVVFPICHSE